jgi:hypothetical protein
MLRKILNTLNIRNVVGTALVAGVMLVMASPSVMAQGGRRGERCDRNSGNISGVDYGSRYDNRYDNSQYYNDRIYNDRYYNNNNNNRYSNNAYYNGRYYGDGDYYENQNTTGKALKRVGIGAAIGAGAGVLLGGKTGAMVGAGAGALGGYIYHRGKVNGQQGRYPY